MTHSSKREGNGFAREVVRTLRAHGLAAKRMPLSGQDEPTPRTLHRERASLAAVSGPRRVGDQMPSLQIGSSGPG